MIQHNYPYVSYPMAGMSPQMPITAPVQNPSQFLVPGITPGTMSPGGFGAYSAGSPAIPTYGVNLPPEQAAQLFAQTPSVPESEEPFVVAPGSPTMLGTEYVQGFLRTQIGKRVKIEFLFGANSLVDRTGTLLEVGIDYVTIRETETDDLLNCDIYSIKFVTFYK